MGNYWDEQYVKYWRSRVKESQKGGGKSGVVQGDAKSEDDSVYEKVFKKTPFAEGKLLDVGCAWGRMFPLFAQQKVDIYGADISAAMIKEAAKEKGENIKSLVNAPAEELPFEDAYFDNVTCVATFDATTQNRSLSEFFRVLRKGGHLYLTGKNDNYFEDDEMALAAEKGARAKGHPNFFTDVAHLLDVFKEKGHTVLDSYFFLRRGDFGKFAFEKKAPEKFYEWLIVVRKENENTVFSKISDDYSKTFKKVA